MTVSIELEQVVRAARELAKAARWQTAASLLDGAKADSPEDQAAIALASLEVAIEGDWFGGTNQARERLKVARSHGSGWDLEFMELRIDYRSTIMRDGGFVPGPEGKDPQTMAELRRRAGRLRDEAPDGTRRGWAEMYLGLIADNVFAEQDVAPAHYEKALEAGEAGDPFLAREALRHLGGHDHENGNAERALQRWGRATELGARAGTVSGTLSQQLALAGLARDTGDAAGAALLAREIARWADAIGAPFLAAQAKDLT